MALSDHLREVRARTLRVAVVLLAGIVVALFFFDPIFGLVYRPYADAAAALGQDVNTLGTINGAGGPLMIHLKLAGLVGLVATRPYWLYQIWAFILPGLHRHERKWSRIFAAVAGPLFLAGVAVGYLTLPKGLEILIGFTPDQLTSLVEFGSYFSFLTRTLLVFGVAFEIPVFVLLLNFAGVLSGKAIGAHRAWIVVLTFVFAAVATPSTDPFSMVFLAVPMIFLFGVSEVVARLNDRRRARAAGREPADDELSEI